MTVAPRKALPQRIDVVVIGSSTGGPDALAKILPGLSASFPVPILIAQHMPAAFTKRLAERLNAACALPVREGFDQALAEPGTVWIAPGGYHMEARRTESGVLLVTHSQPPVHSCRPAADVLFRSVAAAFGSRVLGVVLTGMGCDGLEGSRTIVEAGGTIYAQDEESSVVWSMPRHVAEANLAELVLSPEKMPDAMTMRVARNRVLTKITK